MLGKYDYLYGTEITCYRVGHTQYVQASRQIWKLGIIRESRRQYEIASKDTGSFSLPGFPVVQKSACLTEAQPGFPGKLLFSKLKHDKLLAF